MKRFFERAVAVEEEAGGFGVRLDGRPLRTPGRNLLLVPTAALAEALAAEWNAQGEEVDPRALLLTRLCATVLDLMPARREDAVREACDFARGDTLCYRVPEPRDLVERQEREWGPWLAWTEATFGARLRTTSGIGRIEQPPGALARLEAQVRALADWRLVGVHALARQLHSLVLALAVERGVLEAERAFELAHLEELYEVERWGEVDLQIRRHARLREEIAAAGRFLALLPRSSSEPPAAA